MAVKKLMIRKANRENISFEVCQITQELSLKSVVTGLIEQCIQIITNAIKKIPG